MAQDVLVVEDEPDIRRLITLHLERDGFVAGRRRTARRRCARRERWSPTSSFST